MVDKTNEGQYEALILGYSAGILDQAQSMIMAAHIALSAEARALMHMCEAIGGALLNEHCEPVAMRSDSRARVLGLLDGKRPVPAHRQTSEGRKTLDFPEDVVMPECVMHSFSCTPCHSGWKTVYPGLRVFELDLSCKSSGAKLMRAAPAFHTPRHRHDGLEITLVLDGGLSDDNGFYKRGDLVVADSDRRHSMDACRDQGCVCMVVTSGPVRFTGLAALLNPFFRF